MTHRDGLLETFRHFFGSFTISGLLEVGYNWFLNETHCIFLQMFYKFNLCEYSVYLINWFEPKKIENILPLKRGKRKLF